MKLTRMYCHTGIAAANTAHVQYFDRVDCRKKYDEFYEQLVRVKDIATLSFANDAQQLLVRYVRDDLRQQRAANWYHGHWTGTFCRYSLAHALYTVSNNNIGTEVDWRDMKGQFLPSANTQQARPKKQRTRKTSKMRTRTRRPRHPH